MLESVALSTKFANLINDEFLHMLTLLVCSQMAHHFESLPTDVTIERASVRMICGLVVLQPASRQKLCFTQVTFMLLLELVKVSFFMKIQTS